ncbi:MAG: nicotinate-nucleotide adenylyltransferase [Leptolinea sp.]
MAGLRVGRIGLFGGTFDPPHLGHSILAAEARHALQLDRVLWILTPLSPLKSEKLVSALEQRLKLVKAALAEMPEFEFCDVDISSPPPHYALDTIRILQRQNPQATLIYIMGGDSLQNLPAWHESQLFVNEVAEIGVLRRPGVDLDLESLEGLLPGLKAKVTFFMAPLIEISGADIRERIRKGRPYQYFLLPAVHRCIEDNTYYKNGSHGI